jgi:hypothetical protein
MFAKEEPVETLYFFISVIGENPTNIKLYFTVCLYCVRYVSCWLAGWWPSDGNALGNIFTESMFKWRARPDTEFGGKICRCIAHAISFGLKGFVKF